MRILVVTPWFPTTAAPQSGLFVAREAAALATTHEVRVLHLDWTGSFADEVPVTPHTTRRVVLRRSRPLDFARSRRIVERAARKADVLHTHALPVLLPWLADRPRASTWVHSEHWSGLTSPETVGRGERALLPPLARLLARPDAVVAESSRLVDAIRPHRDAPVDVVPCIVPESTVAPWPDAERLVAVGGLIPRKGPLIAVEAVAELRRRGRDTRLTWVGDGPQRTAAEARASQLGVGDAVAFTGILPPAGVAAELDAARLFVLPTQGDNFCVVAAEALSHGRPIVSGAATGAVDYAAPQVSRFVDTASAGAYADAVEELLSATASSSAREVSATVRGRFAPETVRDLLDDVYRRAGAGA
ncbi:glycosyltransferase family 4 protein [Microbacterium sp. ET2]|uniref:glycosyltransferase family 4 protein n=1 Tax=Microbacterium albipurpureum TaxID=3050384 RepID=UPI00259C7A72|nr:glycosyltransferase family 4 protein [Microbacterium sp. ET2 (Ac-2212)]WJL95095.1 glycosyltransferase family 4 protein [Microbacterium sp. ET2 (Ac-2212)]